ncbi:hypothetical protein SUGI_0020220 [Cryptomeria japonica]|nr:hypothetical protein SUGI_0020220 [Cryptomeria japonica]
MVRNSTFKDFIFAWPTGGKTSKWGSLWIVGPFMVTWHIWKERNRKIFREEELEVTLLINKIQAAIEETINGKIHGSRFKYYTKWDMEMEQVWNLKQSSSHFQGVKSTEWKKVKWTPPPPGWKKLNFDGTSRGNPGVSGFGAVVRYEKGSLVGAICGPVGIATNNVAEITALEEGLKWASSNGVSKVMIEGDSQVILSRIIKKGSMNWRLNAWIPRINCLLQKLTDYHLHHIFHEGNQVADFLANQGIAKTLLIVMSSANAGNRDF